MAQGLFDDVALQIHIPVFVEKVRVHCSGFDASLTCDAYSQVKLGFNAESDLFPEGSYAVCIYAVVRKVWLISGSSLTSLCPRLLYKTAIYNVRLSILQLLNACTVCDVMTP